LRLVPKEAPTRKTVARRWFFAFPAMTVAAHFPAGIGGFTCANLRKIGARQVTWLSTLTKSSDTT